VESPVPTTFVTTPIESLYTARIGTAHGPLEAMPARWTLRRRASAAGEQLASAHPNRPASRLRERNDAHTARTRRAL